MPWRRTSDLDFWGLSIHHGAKTNPFKGKHLYRYLPVHIQSHFIVYRKRFVQSPELQAYWNEHADDRKLYRFGTAVRSGVHQTVLKIGASSGTCMSKRMT